MRHTWALVAGGVLFLVLVAWVLRHPAVPEAREGTVLDGEALVAWTPATRIRAFGLERLHPFDVGKMDTIARHLVDEGLLGREDFAVGAEPTEAELLAVHDAALLEGFREPARLSEALEVPVPGFLSASTLDRRVLLPFRLGAGGTVTVARHVARTGGLGINLAGGYHHARPDLAHGFCLYNDVALAVDAVRAAGFTAPILVVDTDAHQGDGNHAAFAEDPSVSTLSLQQAGIFPQPGVPGDLDVALPGGTDDAAYLDALDRVLPGILEQTGAELVFHVAGADVLADDPLAGLGLSPEGLVQRDLLVQRRVSEAGAGLVYVLGGGYGPSAAEAQARSIAAMLRAQAERGGA